MGKNFRESMRIYFTAPVYIVLNKTIYLLEKFQLLNDNTTSNQPLLFQISNFLFRRKIDRKFFVKTLSSSILPRVIIHTISKAISHKQWIVLHANGISVIKRPNHTFGFTANFFSVRNQILSIGYENGKRYETSKTHYSSMEQQCITRLQYAKYSI